MEWLIRKEKQLIEVEMEPLPDDFDLLSQLITEHEAFMDDLSSRQTEIDAVCKPVNRQHKTNRRQSKYGKTSPDSREESPDVDLSYRRR